MFGVFAITNSSGKVLYIPPNKAMMPIFESRLFPRNQSEGEIITSPSNGTFVDHTQRELTANITY